MVIRAFVASLVLSPIALVVVVACGGSGNDGSLFQNNSPDSGPLVPPYDGGSILPIPDANSDAAFACTPAAIGSWKPVWKKPTTSNAGKCDPTQTENFYDDCLAQPLTSSACTSFISANGDCSKCLQSDETDAKYGPVIWHSNRAFYTLNTAGCIANEQNDDSPTGCGAAYQAIVQCEETACTACGVSDYSLFGACEKNAGSGDCSSYGATEGTTCAGELHDANAPASVCVSATNTKSAYLVIAPIFCGGS